MRPPRAKRPRIEISVFLHYSVPIVPHLPSYGWSYWYSGRAGRRKPVFFYLSVGAISRHREYCPLRQIDLIRVIPWDCCCRDARGILLEMLGQNLLPLSSPRGLDNLVEQSTCGVVGQPVTTCHKGPLQHILRGRPPIRRVKVAHMSYSGMNTPSN